MCVCVLLLPFAAFRGAGGRKKQKAKAKTRLISKPPRQKKKRPKTGAQAGQTTHKRRPN
jgi:hypothetical protein